MSGLEKAVVTGALGFIGFRLCSRLLDEGIEVVAVDDLNVRHRQQKERLDFFGRNALFTFLEQTSEAFAPAETFSEADVCFHLPEDPMISGQSLRKSVKAECRKVRAMISGARRKSPFFVLASSTEVYGRHLGEVTECSEQHPVSAFGRLCRVIETLFFKSGTRTAALRLAEVFGPGQPPSGRFHQLIGGKTAGTEGDDVIYIDDAVNALFLAGKTQVPGAYNIASGKPGQWMLGKRYILGEPPLDKDGRGNVWYCIEKARKTFGFEPRIPLADGIARQKEHMQGDS